MPKTTAENAKDIEEIKVRQNEQDVLNAKMAAMLELLTKQHASYEKVIEQFQQAITNMNLLIVKLQASSSFHWKVLIACGSVLLLIAGAILGQFFHIIRP